MPRFVHFAKGALAELLHHLVLANLGASFEPALQRLLRRRNRWVRHFGGSVGRLRIWVSMSLFGTDARESAVDWLAEYWSR
jgi:hypothetical protein